MRVALTPSIEIPEWAKQDLNLRPPGYQPGAPTSLSYPPKGEPGDSRLGINDAGAAVHSSSKKSELSFR